MIAANERITGEAVAGHYDELDRFYRDVWGDHVHHGLWKKGTETRDEAVRELALYVAAAAGIQPGEHVCDIGCGYGATARLIAAECGAHVSAITISPAQNAFAKGLSATVTAPVAAAAAPVSSSQTPQPVVSASISPAALPPEYILGDWLKNDFPSESFDAAVAIESSEHMPDLGAFFQQAHRVLKPGGRLVVTAWLSCDAPTDLQVDWLLEPICREGHMPLMGTFEDYKRVAAEAGFMVEKVEDLSSQVSRTWREITNTFLWKLIRHPKYLRFLLDQHARNRTFALTIFRLRYAYRSGAMRYGLFAFRKP